MRALAMTVTKQVAIAAVVCFLAAARGWAQGEATPLTETERIDLRLLSGQLADPNRVAKTKLEAAQQLLLRSYPQAAAALRGFLEANDNRPAQIAVAQAIVLSGGQNKDFIDPLMAMLTGSEASVRGPAARALATYKNGGVHEKLMKLVHDPKRERAVRFEIITILQGLLDKRAVDALVQLLDDRDAAIRDAAAVALTTLTSIRAFGNDPVRWKIWWQQNKDKPRTEWLADLAESLGWAKAAVDAENAQLRERVVRFVQDLYTALPSARRDAALIGYLKEPLAEVRLAGLKLASRRTLDGERIPPELAQQIQALLTDKDIRVRRDSALLVANIGGEKAARTLLARLDGETSQVVREGLLIALGQLQDPAAIPVVLDEIGAKYEEVAAAAAMALAKIAAKHPFADARREEVAKVLIARYRQNGRSADGAALREALLRAMGIVPGKGVTGVLLDALKDEAVNVRLAAVNALAGLGQAPLAKQLVPLVSDPDRGVRQAAIAALGKLDGVTHLQTILERTRPSIEADAAVRKEAWDVIHQQETPNVLAAVWKDLAEREGVLEHQITVGQKLEAVMVAAKDPKLASFRRGLASVLMAAARPSEAAARLREAYKALKKADSPDTQAAWLEWVEALLAAGDPESVKVIAAEKGTAEIFIQAKKRLNARLSDLQEKGEFSQVVVIAAAALDQLGPRLTVDEANALKAILAKSRQKQVAADRVLVAKAIPQLAGTDAGAARAANDGLKGMGDRAVTPLVGELRKSLTAPKPDPRTEKAIVDVLAQIAPKLVGYDLTADLATKLKCIDGWLKALLVASRST